MELELVYYIGSFDDIKNMNRYPDTPLIKEYTSQDTVIFKDTYGVGLKFVRKNCYRNDIELRHVPKTRIASRRVPVYWIDVYEIVDDEIYKELVEEYSGYVSIYYGYVLHNTTNPFTELRTLERISPAFKRLGFKDTQHTLEINKLEVLEQEKKTLKALNKSTENINSNTTIYDINNSGRNDNGSSIPGRYIVYIICAIAVVLLLIFNLVTNSSEKPSNEDFFNNIATPGTSENDWYNNEYLPNTPGTPEYEREHSK